MGCGCQDIENDEKIIAYYNEKKKQMEGEYSRIWNGPLSSFSLNMIEEKEIISIRRIADDMWEAKCLRTTTTTLQEPPPTDIG